MKKSFFQIISCLIMFLFVVCSGNSEIDVEDPLGYALIVAKGIGNPFSKAEALSKIAIKYAEVGQYDQGLQVANTIVRASDKAIALSGIAAKYAEDGRKDKASEILSQALQVAREIKSYWEGRDNARSKVAIKYAEVGQYDQALQVANAIGNSFWKANALSGIAVEYAEDGRKDKASEILSQALQVANGDRSYRDDALSKVAIKYAEVGQYDQALQVANTSLLKANALSGIAVEYAEDGQYDQALQVANTIDILKASTLSGIAAKYTEAGRKDKASEILSQALQVIVADTSYMYPGYKASELSEIAVKYAEAGRKDKASEVLSQALQVARTMEFKAEAFSEIAVRYAEAGQYEQALQVATTIEEAAYKDIALSEIAIKYADAGRKVGDREKKIFHEIIAAGEQLTETDIRSARTEEAKKHENFARDWKDINLYLFLLSDKISAYVKILTAVGDGQITLEVGSKQLIDFDKELSGYQPPEGFEKSISFLRQGILVRSKYFYYSAEVLKARDEQNYVRAFEMNEKMGQSAIRADSLWNQGVKYLALEIMTAEKEFGKFELSIDQIFQDW